MAIGLSQIKRITGRTSHVRIAAIIPIVLCIEYDDTVQYSVWTTAYGRVSGRMKYEVRSTCTPYSIKIFCTVWETRHSTSIDCDQAQQRSYNLSKVESGELDSYSTSTNSTVVAFLPFKWLYSTLYLNSSTVVAFLPFKCVRDRDTFKSE